MATELKTIDELNEEHAAQQKENAKLSRDEQIKKHINEIKAREKEKRESKKITFPKRMLKSN